MSGYVFYHHIKSQIHSGYVFYHRHTSVLNHETLSSPCPQKMNRVVVISSVIKPVRIVCQSDTHSIHERGPLVPDGDVYVHAGDFTSTGTLQECQEFHDWVAKLPHKHKIVIAGNHDITMDTDYYLKRGSRRFHSRSHVPPEVCQSIFKNSTDLTYLQDSGTECYGIKFWGSPWQPEFYDWAFNYKRGEGYTKWNLIPSDIDVLITHGPPKGQGSVCLDGFDAGCEELADWCNTRCPKLHIFGHIHEGYGVTTDDHTTYVNASTCTRQYRPINPTIVIDVVSTNVVV